MAFLDDMQSIVNRGVASAERTAGSAKLKMERADIVKRRKELAAQLGASLYEPTRSNAVLRSGREALYDDIAALDERRAAIDVELMGLVEQAQGAQTYACTKCGTQVRASDSFCAGCGTPVSEIMASYQVPAPAAGVEVSSDAPRCPSCGALTQPNDVFCMGCGTRLGGEESSDQA